MDNNTIIQRQIEAIESEDRVLDIVCIKIVKTYKGLKWQK